MEKFYRYNNDGKLLADWLQYTAEVHANGGRYKPVVKVV